MAEYRLGIPDFVVHVPSGGLIPDDPSNKDRVLYEAWLALGNVPDPLIPSGPNIPETLSSRQFWTQMAVAGHITENEAVNALGGDIPNSIKQFINMNVPLADRFQARMFFEAPIFERHKRVGSDVAACFALTPAQVDTFWINAALL